MQRACLVGLLAAVVTAGCAAARAGAGPRANTLILPEAGFSDPEVVVAKSQPPQFQVVLHREMPTPGWRFAVDSVKTDREAGRIRAEVTETGPDGMVAQVITRTPLRIPLGSLEPGSYVLELWLRRGTTGEHRLVHALVLEAR